MKNMNPTWRQWLRANLKEPSPQFGPCNASLAMLTGQDARALEAIAACWQLCAISDNDGARAALEAVRALLPAMQEKCRPLARELIAWAMDWHNRDQLWPLVQPAKKRTEAVAKPIFLDRKEGRDSSVIEGQYIQKHGHGVVLGPVAGCSACEDE